MNLEDQERTSTTIISRSTTLWREIFATLKAEAFPPGAVFASKIEARRAIFDYLETFYNRRRRHSSLAYQSPEAVLKKHFQNHPTHLN
ncbi:MAG: IS3 family transposase [Verrucomicrobiales bacterium]|nr:IS3 family transposase [Akkermansiaceae bacterium]